MIRFRASVWLLIVSFIFFFQAEDGIRDWSVTGVQTCALPIALALAREHGTEANAVLLGALAGSGVLPIRVDAYRDAIRAKGVQVDANLRGFDAGLAVATRLKAGGGEGARDPSHPPPPTTPAP